jgi:sugar/nucleoside kinase (ribokinase family)
VAADAAHAAGRKVALTLSDSFCVDRHRDDFLDLVAGGVDILFANEEEITKLYGVTEFDEGVAAVRGRLRDRRGHPRRRGLRGGHRPTR